MASVLNIGRMIGQLCLGSLVDNYGRKKSVIGALVAMSVTCAATAFATDWLFLTIGQFLIGVTIGALSNVMYIYAAEFTTNRYRVLMDSTGGSSLPRLATQALIAYLWPHWRKYLLCVGVMPIFGIVFTLSFMYESPRWLLQKEQVKEATEVLSHIVKFNGRASRLPSNFQLETLRSTKEHFYAWDLFRQHHLLRIYALFCLLVFFEMGMLWAICMLEINKLTSEFDIFLSVLMVGVLSSISVFVALMELKWSSALNRRRLSLILSSGILVTNIAIAILCLDTISLPNVLAVLAVLNYSMTLVKCDFMGSIFVELFPTLMRANMAALAGVSLSLSSVLAPQLLLLAKWWPGLPYLVVSVLNAITLLFTFLVYPNANKMDLAQVEKLAAPPEQLLLVPAPRRINKSGIFIFTHEEQEHRRGTSMFPILNQELMKIRSERKKMKLSDSVLTLKVRDEQSKISTYSLPPYATTSTCL